MPSGAKKRKAAKKKQASNSAPTPSTAHSRTGEDDLKHHDERDSDGGEGELKREDSSSTRSFTTESKSSQGESTGKADNEEEGIVQIDWELKPEEDFESTTFSVESKKESHDGSSSGSSSSSSSSSDDESHIVEKKIVVVEDSPANVDLVEPLDPKKVTKAVDDFSVETSNHVDLVKPIDSLSQVVPQVNDNSLLGEENNLVVETPSVTDSDKVSLSKQVVQVVQVVESVSVENGSSSTVVESFLKENGVENLASLGENSGISSVLMDLGSKPGDQEKTAASSESKQYVVPSTDAKNLVAEEVHVKETEIPLSSDSQPLVASAPRSVQTTSWKSCCGILELFTGSDR